MVVENDGLHGMNEERGSIALRAGYHPIRVTFFEKGSGNQLKVSWSGNQLKVSFQGPNINKQAISPQILFHKN